MPSPVSTKKPIIYKAPSPCHLAPSSCYHPSSTVKNQKKENLQKPVRSFLYFHAFGSWYYRPKTFKKGALVLCKNRKNLWEGPYLIKSDDGKSRYDLATLDGKSLFRIHAKYLKLWQNPVMSDHSLT